MKPPRNLLKYQRGPQGAKGLRGLRGVRDSHDRQMRTASCRATRQGFGRRSTLGIPRDHRLSTALFFFVLVHDASFDHHQPPPPPPPPLPLFQTNASRAFARKVGLAIVDAVAPASVEVTIEGSHLCMAMRGVQQTGATTTTHFAWRRSAL